MSCALSVTLNQVTEPKLCFCLPESFGENPKTSLLNPATYAWAKVREFVKSKLSLATNHTILRSFRFFNKAICLLPFEVFLKQQIVDLSMLMQ